VTDQEWYEIYQLGYHHACNDALKLYRESGDFEDDLEYLQVVVPASIIEMLDKEN